MRPDDEDAFREFVASRMPALRKLAFVTCGDWHAAEDAVANVLAKLYPRWGRLERPDLYAQTMVFRAAIDETRRPWWRRERSGGDRVPDVVQPDHAATTDERLRVRAALLLVPVRQRAVLVLRFYLGMTAEDAAEVLGVRSATVRSQTARGLANLRAALAAGGVVVNETAEDGGRTDASAGPGGSGGVRVATAALHR